MAIKKTKTEVIETWRKTLPSDPPIHCSAMMMERYLAYYEQEKTYGKITSNVGHKLKKHVRALREGKEVLLESSPRMQSGSILTRHYQGRDYSVTVTDNGFLFNGTYYGSLSAIAKAITGTIWNGKRFFGINQ